MTTVIIIYLILTLLSIGHIILYGSRPEKSLSWLLIILLFPFLGVGMYLIFGLNRRRYKFYNLKANVKRKLYDTKFKESFTASLTTPLHTKKENKLVKLVANSGGFPVHSDNELKVLHTGKEAFDLIYSEIEKAEKFIHLQYYIYEEGEIADTLFELFEKKTNQGVEVRLLYDAIGSFSLGKKIIEKYRNAGIKVFPTMPLAYGSFLFTLNYRNHRKIMVIDGEVGFTGGINVSDKYIDPSTEMGLWDDTHLYIKGPCVDSLSRIFIKDYYFASDEELLLNDHYLPKIKKSGDRSVQLVSSGPDSANPTIMQQYIQMINLAEKSIYISNPYFIPNNAMLEAIRISALGGVNVKILVPTKSDSWLAKHSMLSFFEELLHLKVEIYEQRENFLHSKVIVIDEKIASVGSGNFDHRSFEHNFETNALIYDEEISEEIAEQFLKDCDQSNCLEYDTFKERPLKQRISEGVARFFSPLL